MSNSTQTHRGSDAVATKTTAPRPQVKTTAALTKRLQSELMQLMMSGSKEISAFPEGENLLVWRAKLVAPAGTVYEGLTFKLSLEFPSDYPFHAPTVRFVSPCFHPNVDEAGNICLDILKEEWSAALSVRTILLSLQTLLADPNNSSPLNIPAAELWSDQKRFRVKVLEWSKKE